MLVFSIPTRSDFSESHRRMQAKCNSCGAETGIAELFFKERRTFRRRTNTYCPVCWQKGTVSIFRNMLLLQLAWGPIGLLFLLFFPELSVGWIFTNLFIFGLLSICTILPHEFAHAAAAKVCGMAVIKIIIGSGKTLFTKRIFGLNTEFKTVPAGGLALAVPTSADHFRLKQFAFIFAGPLINLLLAAGIYPFVADQLWSMQEFEHHLAPGPLFFYANLAVVIENLWPHDVTTSLGKLPSDGKLLLQTLRSKPEAIAQSLALRFVFEAAESYQKKDYVAARNTIETGRLQYPENFYLLNWLGILLMRFKEYPQARALSFKILPEAEKLAPSHHAMILNNIAYANALIGDPALLAEADDFSARAMQTLSWHPAIVGTRGTVLVQLGRVDEGIELLKTSMAGHEDVQSKAENACFLAMAEVKRGNDAASRQYLEEARRCDSTCYLLDRAAAALAKLSK